MKSLNKEMETICKNSDLILNELKTMKPAQNEVSSSYMNEVKVIYQNDDFTVTSGNSNSSYGVRSIVDGKLGFVNTNATNAESLKEAAREAQLLADLTPANEHQQIASEGTESLTSDMLDEAMLLLKPADLVAKTQMMVDELRKDSRVAIDSAEFKWIEGVHALTNSHGLQSTSSYAYGSFFAMGMGKTEAEVGSFDYDGSVVVKASEIDPEIQRTMTALRESMIGGLGVQAGDSYKGQVLLHPDVVIDILGSLVSYNTNGEYHASDMSSWKGKVGEIVASDMIQVYEDPTNKTLLPASWTLFDREGVPCKRNDVISNGSLNFVAHNSMSAHKMNTSSTGNAIGGTSAVPAVGLQGLCFAAAEDSSGFADDEMLARLGRGLLVKRFSGNADPISGNFSGVAKNSYWVESGIKTHGVTEVMISGNLFDLLKSIVAVGNQLHVAWGASASPYILVDGVSVTSG